MKLLWLTFSQRTGYGSTSLWATHSVTPNLAFFSSSKDLMLKGIVPWFFWTCNKEFKTFDTWKSCYYILMIISNIQNMNWHLQNKGNKTVTNRKAGIKIQLYELSLNPEPCNKTQLYLAEELSWCLQLQAVAFFSFSEYSYTGFCFFPLETKEILLLNFIFHLMDDYVLQNDKYFFKSNQHHLKWLLK